jgi:hypothetical protein
MAADSVWTREIDGIRYVALRDYLAVSTERDEARAELSACTEHPGGCGYWREAARQRERELAEARERTCEWTPDEDGVYRTSCGEAFMLITSTPTDNAMRFCPYCGARLVEMPPAPVEQEETRQNSGLKEHPEGYDGPCACDECIRDAW